MDWGELGEDGGVVDRGPQRRVKHQTGRENDKTKQQFYLPWWSSEQRRTIGNRGEKKGASWSKCMKAGRRSHV